MGNVIYDGPSPEGRLVSYGGVEYAAPKGVQIAVPDELEALLLQQGGDWTSGDDGAPSYVAPRPPDPRTVVMVDHGAHVDMARPLGRSRRLWVGSVEPANALDGDLRIGTSLGGPEGSLIVYGSSTAAGVGATTTAERVTDVLAGLLGLDGVVNRALPGAQVTLQEVGDGNDGGYARVLQNEPRPAAAPFAAPNDTYLLWWMNDPKWIPPARLAPYQAALRLSIARARCEAVFEEGDASVALGGSWSPFSVTDRNSGAGGSFSNAQGDTATVSVPATFPGGSIVVGAFSTPDVDVQVDVDVDGELDGTWDVTGQTGLAEIGTRRGAVCYRITGLEPGAHTVTLTRSDATGDPWVFDWWGWESLTPPVVVAPLMPHAEDYSALDGGLYAVDGAAVSALNVATAEVVAEFDSRVVCPSVDPVPASWRSDGWHLNDTGHAEQAQRLYEQIKAAVAWRLQYRDGGVWATIGQ